MAAVLERGIGSDVLWAQDTYGDAIKTYRVVALGTTIIIDRKGQIMYRDEGVTSYTRLKIDDEKVREEI